MAESEEGTSVEKDLAKEKDVVSMDVDTHELLRQSIMDPITKAARKPKKKSRKTFSKKPVKKTKPLNHKCHLCEKMYSSRPTLNAHIATHGPKPYNCEQCPLTFKVRKYLTRHIRSAHTDCKNIKCDVCGKLFLWQSKLRKHMRIHTGEKPYKCEVCDKSFTGQYSLQSHMYIHTNEKPYKCAFCEYSCRDNSTLRKHQERHLGLEKWFECTICYKKIKNKFYLKEHIAKKHLNVETKKPTCDYCGRGFTVKTNLAKHIKTIHEKISYAVNCHICGKKASNPQNLKSHMRTHTDLRPFKCPVEGCDKRFKDKSSQKKHCVTHFPPRHTCTICDRGFTRLSRLHSHIVKVHERSRCVECDYCGDRFYSKNYLVNHIQRKHIVCPKYECDTCGFVTRNKPVIVRHLKTSHDHMNDLQCEICGVVVKKHIYLKQHYWKTHNVKYKTKTRSQKPKVQKVELSQEVTIKEEILSDMEEEKEVDLLEIEKHEVEDDESKTDEKLSQAKEILAQSGTLPDDIFSQLFTQRISRDENNDEVKLNGSLDIHAEELCKEEVLKLLIKADEKSGLDLQEKRKLTTSKYALIRVDPESLKGKIISNRKSTDFTNYNIANLKKYGRKGKNDGKITEKTKKIGDKSVQDKEISNKSEGNEPKKYKDDDEDEISDDNIQIEEYTTLSGRKVKRKVHIDLNVDMKVKKTKHKKDNEEYIQNEGKSNKKKRKDKRERKEKREKKEKKQSGVKNGLNLKLNIYQCYVCFKVFKTKEELTSHCKEHFDVCSEKMLKKCPFCDYVTKHNLARHAKLVHKVDIKLKYGKIKDKKDCTDGSRYAMEVTADNVKEIEVIPSIKNLNKMASMKLDKDNREAKDKMISKRKLVKHGNEWMVQNEIIEDGFQMPKFTENALKAAGVDDKDDHIKKLRKLYHFSKKDGVAMLFPCDDCEKICQTLSALILHKRRHDPNKKPFKKKVWKHKLTDEELLDLETRKNKNTVVVKCDDKPKPIVNKHKCDPKLKEFYMNNIRGGDIEFWQFLKIFNKMGRENVNDFEDLESRFDFGVHRKIVDDNKNKIASDTRIVKNKTKISKIVKVKKLRREKFKRVIRLSTKEFRKREEIKNMLRQKIQESN